MRAGRPDGNVTSGEGEAGAERCVRAERPGGSVTCRRAVRARRRGADGAPAAARWHRPLRRGLDEGGAGAERCEREERLNGADRAPLHVPRGHHPCLRTRVVPVTKARRYGRYTKGYTIA